MLESNGARVGRLNARRQARLEAGAQRTLEAVACTRWLGAAQPEESRRDSSQELCLTLTPAPGPLIIHRLIAEARTAGIGNSMVSPF
jgi:hypothetical protein